MATILEKHPGFVAASLKEDIRPFIWYLEQELNMESKDLQQIFVRAPELMNQSFAEVLKPTMDYFIHDIKCRRDKFARMLTVFPHLLCYSLRDNIQTKIRWLKETVGIHEKDIPNVCLHR